MLNNYTSPSVLPVIHELKRERERQIDQLVNNLKIADVKTEDAFNSTLESVKAAILLKAVNFGEPELVDHTYEERPMSFMEQLQGGSKDHYLHQINIRFKGDIELFQYRPETFSVSSSEHGLILPDMDSITVNVDLPNINPAKAIEEAKKLLAPITRLVQNNNLDIDQWNIVTERWIESRMQNKRQELIKIFG